MNMTRSRNGATLRRNRLFERFVDAEFRSALTESAARMDAGAALLAKVQRWPATGLAGQVEGRQLTPRLSRRQLDRRDVRDARLRAGDTLRDPLDHSPLYGKRSETTVRPVLPNREDSPQVLACPRSGYS